MQLYHGVIETMLETAGTRDATDAPGLLFMC